MQKWQNAMSVRACAKPQRRMRVQVCALSDARHTHMIDELITNDIHYRMPRSSNQNMGSILYRHFVRPVKGRAKRKCVACSAKRTRQCGVRVQCVEVRGWGKVLGRGQQVEG